MGISAPQADDEDGDRSLALNDNGLPGTSAPSAHDSSSSGLPAPSDDATFKSLGLSDWLSAVTKSLGMTTPTQVQSGCIPAILSGRDVIGTAQTGSGKTAAFALPILQKLARDPYGVYALVLTPTRELAMQLAEQFRALGAGMSLKDAVVIGGLDMQQQARELARRPHVVIATPGRLKVGDRMRMAAMQLSSAGSPENL